MKENIRAKYWNEQGIYQALVTPLQALIPAEGEVPQGKKQNKHLERFRKAMNCYYDLYNNGLCNRAREFSRLYQLPGIPREIHARRNLGSMLSGYTEICVDTAMDDFIIKAYQEQMALGKVPTVDAF